MLESIRSGPQADVLSAAVFVVGGLCAALLTGDSQQWWFAGVVAAAMFPAEFVSDRMPACQRVALVRIAPVLVLFGWVTVAGVSAYVYAFVVGIGLGSGINRLLFGFLFPVPEPRQKRHDAAMA